MIDRLHSVMEGLPTTRPEPHLSLSATSFLDPTGTYLPSGL
jgi:hypothetical protein